MITRREALVVAAGSLIATAAAIVDADQQRSPQQQQRTPREYADLLEEPERVARLQVPRVVSALALQPARLRTSSEETMAITERASSIGRCTVPVMMTGAVDHDRPMEITGCQARRCRCPNARRSASR